MILIFPPIAKPCEPPAGVALLAGALKEYGFSCSVIDANIQGLMHLIQNAAGAEDTWSRRALKNREQILSDLKDPDLYENMDRYHHQVRDLNKLLTLGVDTRRFKISLSDYADTRLSSVNSRDLLKSAATYRENPFYPYFEQNLKPQILAQFMDQTLDQTFDQTLGRGGRYIGISMCYLNQALVSFALAGWLKDTFKEVKLIMGGGLLSSWMSRPDWKDPFRDLIDITVRGEGEGPLLDFSGVPDVQKRHFVPDYGFAKDESYLAPGRILPFRASIGCYWSKCRFCPEKAEIRPYSSQRASRTLEDLRHIEAVHAPDVVHLVDNSVTPAFLKAMSTETFSFKWYGFVRFEKEFLDLNFCHALKTSGCDMLKLGLESGDQQVLDRMGKGTDLNIVSSTLKNLHDAGIQTFVYLLFGTSFENEQAAYHTLDFVHAHQTYIDYLNLAVFNLPKFSEDSEGLITQEFYHGDLSLYLNFTHPYGWERRKVKHFIDKKFKKAVYQAGHIKRNPAFFSSNHAIFFKPLERKI